MEEVANIVTQSFNTPRQEINSQRVSDEEVERCRTKYLQAIRKDNTLHSFLDKQSIKLQEQLTNIQLSPISTTVAFYTDCTKETLLQVNVEFDNHFQTIGRYGQIHIPFCVNQVSRVHAMIFHLTHTDGRGMYVFLDFWSKGGTVIAGTTHCSQPNDRRVLIVPDNEPVILHLGGMLDTPFQVILNAKKCLICQSALRTELFETCMHLVACKECLHTLIQKSVEPVCPVCRRPISLQCTRNAHLECGEYQTCNIDISIDNSEIETHMNQLHTLITKQKDK